MGDQARVYQCAAQRPTGAQAQGAFDLLSQCGHCGRCGGQIQIDIRAVPGLKAAVRPAA
jgi:hypothetical protein